MRRKLEAECALLTTRVQEHKTYKADGHASMFGLLRASLGWSERECRQRMQIARLVDAHPAAGETLFEAGASVANIAAIARAFANPRCREELELVMGELLNEAEREENDKFRRDVERFVMIHETSSKTRHAAAHDNRAASCAIGEAGGRLVATFGSLDAARNREILDKERERQFDKDWEWTVATYGEEAACPALMPRTDAQRSADAVTAIFNRGAAASPDAKPPTLVNNVLIDWHTFSEWMIRRRLFPERHVDPFEDPTPLVIQRRCETGEGVLVHPDAVLQHILEGYVRFVVLDEKGVPIRWGRRRRLFSGPAREAVMSLSPRCTHRGCRVRSGNCQGDHLHPWSEGGHTDPDNGAPGCGRHNRDGNRGFRRRRDSRGRWHTYRPDGTEIT
jgi:hypothetical protein